MKHYRCPKCKRVTAVEGNWVPSCKCVKGAETKMEEIKE